MEKEKGISRDVKREGSLRKEKEGGKTAELAVKLTTSFNSLISSRELTHLIEPNVNVQVHLQDLIEQTCLIISSSLSEGKLKVIIMQ